jgi:hypothetical protein
VAQEPRYADVAIPDELPRTITRNRALIKCVLGELTADLGVCGRAGQAGRWALTGSVNSPITRTSAVGCPPTREEVLAEVGADPVGSTAPPGVPTDFCDQTVSLPTVYDLSYEETSANEVIMQGRPGGIPVDPNAYPPPQYGEGIQAAIRWLRGQSTIPPVDNAGCSPYGT